MFYENTLKNKEKSLRHVVMVGNFLVLNKTLYCKYCRKKEKIDMYDFSVSDCTQEQNGIHHPPTPTVRKSKWPSVSRKSVETQKSCYYSNMTSHFSPFLKGFKAWVRGGFGACDWMTISLAKRPRTNWNFFPKLILWSSCALTFNYGHIKACYVTKNWKWRELANLLCLDK